METIIKYSLLVVFGLTLMCDLPGQGWERYYPEAFLPEIGVESQNSDFLIFSYSDLNSNNPGIPYFNRVSSDGKTIFSKELHSDSTIANSHLFVLAGNDNSIYKINRGRINSIPGSLDLIKYSPDGNELWREFLEFSSCKYFSKGVSNDFWVVEVQEVQPDSNNQVSVFHRLDQNGLEIQEFEIGLSPVLDHIVSFQNVSDGFLVFEIENSNTPLNQDSVYFSLKKVNFLGYPVWEKTGMLNSFSCPINESYTTIDQDGNLYALYPLYSSTNQVRGFGLVKFDKNGETKWEKGIHLEYDDEIFRNICFQPFDSTLAIAYSETTAEGNMPFLLKLDLQGNQIWDKRVGFNKALHYNTNFVKPAKDGGFFIVGFANGSGTFLIKTNPDGLSVTNQIAGTASVNQDSCFYSIDNIKSKNAIFEIGDETGYSFYASIDSAGYFNAVVDTGSYHVTSSSFNGYWSICADTLFTQFDTLFSKDTLNFILQPEVDCPSMEVTISTPFLRRCFDNTLYVNYCNEGTIPAEDAYVEITIDPRLEVTGSEIPWSGVNGNVYTFDLGDVGLFECGDFKIYTHLPCDSVELGQTLCLEAHIFPDSICTPPDSLWNGSDLRVSGYCDGDSVRFIIKNEGAALPTQQDFIIIEDDMVMRFGNTTPLGAEETYEVSVPAEGSTYRLQMEQVPGHPWSRIPGVTIENCGENVIGGTNTGFVTMFEADDAADFLDVECVEVRGSYDPNDKEAFPKGVCASHFIDNDTEIEYKIRFQNVGNDTAFKVVIKDTLSEFLDPATIEVGVASHPFTWSLSGLGILTFTFDNINLVDKQTNEPGSHGFVKYRIAQKPDNAVDTQIKNKAAIYFDFNAPIITNTVEHLIGEDYLVPQTGNLSLAGVVTRDDGLPVDSAKVFLSNNCVTYTDEEGKYIFTNLEEGLDYSIWVEKDENHAKGLTFLDLYRTRLFLLGFDTLDSRYRNFASDANLNGATTTLDLVYTTKVMNRVYARFPNVDNCWRFFDGTIPYPNNNGQFPGYQISIPNLQEDVLGNNFIGVKLGDVVYEDSLPRVQLNQQLSLGQPVNTCGNVIGIPIIVSGDNLSQVEVVAAEVQYDPAMMELYATSFGDEVFPGNTQLEMGTAGQYIATFTRADGFSQSASMLVAGYLYFIPLAQPGEPIHIEFAENIHPVIVQTTDERLSEVSLQALDFTYGGGPSWNVNVNTLDVSPCDNVGVEVCLAIQDTSNQFTYWWNTGETTPCIYLNSSANYNCWVADTSGCANLIAGYENVQAPNPMSLDNYQLVDASGANAEDGSISGIVISGGSGPYSFLWNDGSTAASRFNLLPGYYEVTITDDVGCNLIQGFTISYTSSLISVNEFGIGAAVQPNPSPIDQSTTLNILTNKTSELSIEINDVLGRVVHQADQRVQAGETNLVLPPQKTKGIYLVSIKESGKVLQTIKWSIQ